MIRTGLDVIIICFSLLCIYNRTLIILSAIDSVLTSDTNSKCFHPQLSYRRVINMFCAIYIIYIENSGWYKSVSNTRRVFVVTLIVFHVKWALWKMLPSVWFQLETIVSIIFLQIWFILQLVYIILIEMWESIDQTNIM